MLFRRALLIMGAGALLAGFALLALWVRGPAVETARKPQSPPVLVLTAAHALPAGTLLRGDELRWEKYPQDAAPPGGLVQGRTALADLSGAAVRRDLRAGEPVRAEDVVHPDQPGFLPAVLRPGMRAATIAVGQESGAAGLIAPGDHVDVILTQIFNQQNIGPALRSVGETILRNLRVVAVDQTVSPTEKAKQMEPRMSGSKKPALPKTVTVELTPQQAQVLAVGNRLGQLQLTLRSASEPKGASWRSAARPPPTWASEASPALKHLETEEAGSRRRGPPPRRGAQVEVMRGAKIQQRCFDSASGAAVPCGSIKAGSPAVKPAAPTPSSEPPARGAASPAS